MRHASSSSPVEGPTHVSAALLLLERRQRAGQLRVADEAASWRCGQRRQDVGATRRFRVAGDGHQVVDGVDGFGGGGVARCRGHLVAAVDGLGRRVWRWLGGSPPAVTEVTCEQKKTSLFSD